MTGGNFDIITTSGKPAAVGDTDCLVIDQFDWLQLTLGRFLAPARRTQFGGVEYLVSGSVEKGAETAEQEVNEFRRAVEQLASHLQSQIESTELTHAHVLLALDVLLELRLPDASDSNGFHLRGGMLQIAQWGLSTGGTSLGALIGAAAGRSGTDRSVYYERMMATLLQKYKLEPAAPASVPNGDGSDYPFPMPPARSLPIPRRLPPADDPAPPSRRQSGNGSHQDAEDAEDAEEAEETKAGSYRYDPADEDYSWKDRMKELLREPPWAMILLCTLFLLVGLVAGLLLRSPAPSDATPRSSNDNKNMPPVDDAGSSRDSGKGSSNARSGDGDSSADGQPAAATQASASPAATAPAAAASATRAPAAAASAARAPADTAPAARSPAAAAGAPTNAVAPAVSGSSSVPQANTALDIGHPPPAATGTPSQPASPPVPPPPDPKKVSNQVRTHNGLNASSPGAGPQGNKAPGQ